MSVNAGIIMSFSTSIVLALGLIATSAATPTCIGSRCQEACGTGTEPNSGVLLFPNGDYQCTSRALNTLVHKSVHLVVHHFDRLLRQSRALHSLGITVDRLVRDFYTRLRFFSFLSTHIHCNGTSWWRLVISSHTCASTLITNPLSYHFIFICSAQALSSAKGHGVALAATDAVAPRTAPEQTAPRRASESTAVTTA
jgi:hypothetical protein